MVSREQPVVARVSTAAPRDRVQRERLRLGRRVATLLAAAAALCAIVVWHRDATHVEMACARVEAFLPPLRAELKATGALPLHYPKVAGLDVDSPNPGLRYADPAVIRWANHVDQPVIIGYGPANGLIVRSNGYAVIVFDRGQLRVEWRSVHELGPRLAEQRRRASDDQASP